VSAKWRGCEGGFALVRSSCAGERGVVLGAQDAAFHGLSSDPRSLGGEVFGANASRPAPFPDMDHRRRSPFLDWVSGLR